MSMSRGEMQAVELAGKIIDPTDNYFCPRHMLITGPLFSTKETSSHDGDQSNDRITIGILSRETGYDRMLICEAMIKAGMISDYNPGVFNKWYDYDEIMDMIDKSDIPFSYVTVSTVSNEYHISTDTVAEAISNMPDLHIHKFRQYTYISRDSIHPIIRKIYEIRKEKEAKRKALHESYRHLRKLENEPQKPKINYSFESERAKALNQGLYTLDDSAKYLGMPRETLRNYSAMGMVPVHMFGRYKFFHPKELDTLAEELKGYSIVSAAQRIGIGEKKVRAWMDKGILPYKKLGTTKRIMISFEAVEEQRKINLLKYSMKGD